MSIVLIGTRANPELNELISKRLGIPLTKCRLGNHPNSETKAIVDESVRGQKVYVISTATAPINDNLMEVCFIVSACKFSNASQITLIMANYPYARSDKVTQQRECIGAAFVSKMLVAAGVDRLITISLHSEQIQGVLQVKDIRSDNIKTYQTFGKLIQKKFDNLSPETHIVVAPDEGAVKAGRNLSNYLGLGLAVVMKVRNPETNQIDKMTLNETEKSVQDKIAFIFDDIGDTLGTLIKACSLLKDRGVKSVIAVLTHGVFSGNALQKMNECDILTHVITTNTMPSRASESKKIVICDISELIVTNIMCLEMGTSLSQSSLFK